jgi:hypothetical protein
MQRIPLSSLRRVVFENYKRRFHKGAMNVGNGTPKANRFNNVEPAHPPLLWFRVLPLLLNPALTSNQDAP